MENGKRFYLNTVASPWILRIVGRVFKSLKIINQLELLAILCTVLTCSDLLKGHQVWFWCDNTTALSVVIHGYVWSAHLAKMTNEIHLLFARLQITAWFEWVPTVCNITDIPSRPQGQLERDFYAQENISRCVVHMIFPSVERVEYPELDTLRWRSAT